MVLAGQVSVATECEDGRGGYYCSTEGLTTVTGTCWAGRFCFYSLYLLVH